MKKPLLFLTVLLASCAHKLESASDLQINESYPVLGAKDPELRVCTLKAQNVMTMIPTPAGPLPVAVTGQTNAFVCGEVDCSKAEKEELREGAAWYCAPIEMLLDQPKSE